MNADQREGLGFAAVLLAAFILSNIGWANIFFMTNLLSPPTELTKEQGLALSFNGQLVVLAIVIELGAFAFMGFVYLFLPFILDVANRYKIVIEETEDKPDGTARPDKPD